MNEQLVLIDSSVWIPVLRKDGHPLIKGKVRKLLEADLVAITPIIQLELLGGAKTENEYKRLKDRLKVLHHVPITENEWEEAAYNAFRLRRKGKSIPYTDILIATVALVHDLVLLHTDHHFELIASETPLKTESLINPIAQPSMKKMTKRDGKKS